MQRHIRITIATILEAIFPSVRVDLELTPISGAASCLTIWCPSLLDRPGV